MAGSLRHRTPWWPVALWLLLAGPACAEGEPGTRSLERIFVPLGGETFSLEVAAEPAVRFQGLSGRRSIPRNEGMLFVLPREQPFAMVMRDCPVAIDVAFLDAGGRVVATHEMRVEPPRGPGESRAQYERRLPQYPSPVPVQFAIETAGGRLAEVGLEVGDRVPLDLAALAARAR